MAARRNLIDLLRRQRPDVLDAEDAVRDGRVRVDGAIVTNPRSQVRPDAQLVVDEPRVLQGVGKLGYALDELGVSVAGRVALDVGACTGGFTQALLDRGAARVFAVDVGFGQLLGSLRQDPRVVNLERTNVAQVTPALLGLAVELVVIDVSMLALGAAITQLTDNGVPGPGTELVGLVKPMFELRRAELPTTDADFADAVDRASRAATACGWDVLATLRSSVVGHHGAVEFFVHARRGDAALL
jgi:23S rRNA (cytidine1920-2'-O)/16S rRNA (cytidine1409-2'-O)-methyltransferase